MKKALVFLFLLNLFNAFSQTEFKSGKVVDNPESLNHSYMSMDGTWEYYDKKFVDPVFFYTDGVVQEFDIRLFNGKYVKIPYQIENKIGYATYHYTVRNLKPKKEYGIVLYRGIYTCADVFVNNKSIYESNEVSGSGVDIKKTNRYMRLVTFTADENGVADFVFHVSNYELKFGGILLVPQLAEDTLMQSFLLRNIALELCVAGVLIVLAIYNIVIFFLNRGQKMHLWLGLLSIDLIVVVCTLDFSFIGYVRGSIPNWLNYKTSLTSLALIIPFYNLYVKNLYDLKFKWNFIAVIIDYIVPVFIIVSPIQIVSEYLVWCFVVGYLMSVYLCFLILINRKPPNYIYSFNVGIIILMLVTAAYGFVFAQTRLEGNFGYVLFKSAIMSFAVAQTILAGTKRDLLSKENQKIVDKYERKNASYSRFIPSTIVNYLQVADIKDIEAGDNSICDAMILVADIRQFSKMTVKYTTHQVFTLINEYYKTISPIIRAYGGFISKYLGDGIISIFPEKNDSVCRCAVEIQRKFESLVLEFERYNIPMINIGIGIHSGKVAVGFMGNEKHIDAVACAESIVQAVEIEGLNKKFNSNILISETALNYCRTFIDCLYEGVMGEIRGEKTLLYKVIPNSSFAYNNEGVNAKGGME
nr:adenylate/guanylate cyclase domain-containing protein [uncultured Treponema sp.]